MLMFRLISSHYAIFTHIFSIQNCEIYKYIIFVISSNIFQYFLCFRIFIKAGSNSSLSGRGPASLFNNPADRPFWIRPNQGSLIRRRRRRRWSHVLIIMVVFVAILIVGVVIALVLAVGRGWF